MFSSVFVLVLEVRLFVNYLSGLHIIHEVYAYTLLLSSLCSPVLMHQQSDVTQNRSIQQNIN